MPTPKNKEVKLSKARAFKIASDLVEDAINRSLDDRYRETITEVEFNEYEEELETFLTLFKTLVQYYWDREVKK